VWGRRQNPANIERLVHDALATIAEFGKPGADVGTVTDGPLADPDSRRHFATSGLRRTARHLEETSPFYGRRFASCEIRPDALTPENIRDIPVTTKPELVQRGREFRCKGVPTYLATRTTGTTGRPAEVWMSRYEMRLWPAMGALTAVLRDDLRPDDVMQVGISSRATAAIALDLATCQLVGASCRLLGVVPPTHALEALCEDRVTLLSVAPSYLGELVTAARREGYRPEDFHLRRIDVGGEVLSPSLAAAAREVFGVPHVNDLFGMTEILPVTGRTCSQGHLHHDINTGHVEHLDLETGAPAAPGALATVTVTPYYPYRECMPVFRYDTRDVVQCLSEGDLTCELSGLPGTSKVLGKADQVLRLDDGRHVTPRQVVEAVESLPTEPWPARFRAVAHGSRVSLTLPKYAVVGFGFAAALDHFSDAGLDVDLSLVDDAAAPSLRPLRCDLHETTFATRMPLAEAAS